MAANRVSSSSLSQIILSFSLYLIVKQLTMWKTRDSMRQKQKNEISRVEKEILDHTLCMKEKNRGMEGPAIGFIFLNQKENYLQMAAFYFHNHLFNYCHAFDTMRVYTYSNGIKKGDEVLQ